MYLWVFSWDGQRGTLINDVDENHQSVLSIGSFSAFSLADINGDGISEIQGDTFLVLPVDTTEGAPTDTSVFRTFSWNGNVYGFWQSTPQPPEGSVYPQDKVRLSVSATVTPISQAHGYRYRLQVSDSSFQNLERFAVDRGIDSVLFGPPPRFWESQMWMSLLDWWCPGIQGLNYVCPGQTDTDFSFVTVGMTRPKIAAFYACGQNAYSDTMQGIFHNSNRGLTIAPDSISTPEPFPRRRDWSDFTCLVP